MKITKRRTKFLIDCLGFALSLTLFYFAVPFSSTPDKILAQVHPDEGFLPIVGLSAGILLPLRASEAVSQFETATWSNSEWVNHQPYFGLSYVQLLDSGSSSFVDPRYYTELEEIEERDFLFRRSDEQAILENAIFDPELIVGYVPEMEPVPADF